MEIEILEKKNNPLLDRVEVKFVATHPKEKTPTRKQIREGIAELTKANKETVFIDHMDSEFGRPNTRGYAKVYKTKEKAIEVESKSVLKRHGVEADGKEEKKE